MFNHCVFLKKGKSSHSNVNGGVQAEATAAPDEAVVMLSSRPLVWMFHVTFRANFKKKSKQNVIFYQLF